MKKITIFSLLIGMSLLTSCAVQEQEQSRYIVSTSGGMDYLGYTPVSAAWVDKREGIEWSISKCFSDINELRTIDNLLVNPEKFEYSPNYVGEHYLAIYYVPPNGPMLVPFSIDDPNKEIVTARGRSKELYKLFMEKEQRIGFFSYEMPEGLYEKFYEEGEKEIERTSTKPEFFDFDK
jgi:hypothetical protein